jgi:two-component system sensor histidine kinase MtrB
VAAVTSIANARLPGAVLHLPRDPVVVDADVRRLDRILGNLLDNARQHAPGTPVEVTVGEHVGSVTVEVTDRGPGVEPAALPHVFDRFFKAEPSRTAGSSGLGLAIAAEHAALLGGSLTAANRVGGGLVATLRLPVTRSLPVSDVRDMRRDEPVAAIDPVPDVESGGPTDPATRPAR